MSFNLDEQIVHLKAQLLQLETKKTEKTIVKDTYDFFINQHQITPELKTINFTQSPEKMYIVDGNIQSGKTKTLISLAVASLVHKQKSVIIVRNFKEDCVQLVNSINTTSTLHNTYLQETSQVSFDYSACSIKDIYKWMFEKHYTILVLMANTTNFLRLPRLPLITNFQIIPCL